MRPLLPMLLTTHVCLTLRRLNFPANVRVEYASRLILASEADDILTDIAATRKKLIYSLKASVNDFPPLLMINFVELISIYKVLLTVILAPKVSRTSLRNFVPVQPLEL